MAKKSKQYKKKGKHYKKKSGKRSVKTLKKTIKRVLNRALETKTITEDQLSPAYVVPANNVNFANNVFALGPYPGSLPLNQGTGQGARVGNIVQTVKGVFKGSLFPMPYHATTNATPQPCVVKFIIFREKATPTVEPNPSATGSNDIFQLGSSTLPFQNDLSDLWLPYNTDKYQIMKTKTFKVGNSVYDGTGTNLGYQSFSNNDFKLNCPFSFNYTKYLQKQIRFQDNAAYPQKAIFGMFTVVSGVGTNLNAAYVPVGYQFMQEYKFKDA